MSDMFLGFLPPLQYEFSYLLFSEPTEKPTSDGGKSEIKPTDTDESG